MLHSFFICYFILAYDEGYYFTSTLGFWDFAKSTIFSIGASLFFTLLYESPIINLYKQLLIIATDHKKE